ncbi:hypothetical protein SAMN02982989_3544 [Xaviernesmea oryzae]|uniref:RADC family protein n=2 Tax=Xaviernesmea oryzae TaxID=464029 RepID=A0A1X7GB40_9HYPH|nr:hypothetical protein [Xaviernesmea oryzae]SMF67104.1 hypothetical protein SAMN02982989_3544 [Xaviernesmea oryzae]
MLHFPYIGSGPYCYANSFAMMLGKSAPSVTVIEFATGSPFGMQLIRGALPFFGPYGWNPEKGFDDALRSLGWSSAVSKGGSAEDALHRLQAALEEGPVWIGPVEMGHLRHQPGMSGPIGADHYVVALEMAEGRVLLHDPHGHPYVSLPVVDFMEAWSAKTLDYGQPYTMRTGFEQLREVSEEEVIAASIPVAIHWLSMDDDPDVPEATLGNGAAAEKLAGLLEAGCSDDLRGHLMHFAIRVGVRRLADGATCLRRIGFAEAAAVMAEQARIVGSLQYPVAVGDNAIAAALLRRLAPTYDRLLSAFRAFPC